MSSSKRHFTAVIGKKEQGVYVSSSPSSAARKAVSKLCADDKNRKVEFYMRETTQSSEKKVYGPYTGYIEKLKKPIELKGRVIRYKPVAKLNKNKKMRGGNFKIYTYWYKDLKKGKQLQHNLQQRFKDIYTKIPEIKLTTKFGINMEEYTAVGRHNTEKEENRKKKQSKTFEITEAGIMIADNFPNFNEIQAEIINAFKELHIDYEHDPEENVEEINE